MTTEESPVVLISPGGIHLKYFSKDETFFHILAKTELISLKAMEMITLIHMGTKYAFSHDILLNCQNSFSVRFLFCEYLCVFYCWDKTYYLGSL